MVSLIQGLGIAYAALMRNNDNRHWALLLAGQDSS